MASNVRFNVGPVENEVTRILEVLRALETRATYKAVAEVVGGAPRSIGRRLGPRRIEACWVVNGRTGLPTGYPPELRHPKLQSKAEIVRTGAELTRLMKEHRLR